MGLQFTNFATSAIADVAGIASGDLTLNVTAGQGALFPALGTGEYFYAVLTDTSANREVVKVTARATDAFTIVRAQDGTTARAFAQGDSVELRLVKSVMDEFAGVVEDFDDHLDSEYHFAAGTIMIFGQSSAPTGWTRKADWSDNAMLCYASSGSIGSGGSANPQSAHTHTGPSHTHTGPSHTHTGPSHTHSTASHTLTAAEMPSHTHSYSIGSTTLNLLGAGGSSVYTYAPAATVTGSAGSGSAHSHGNTGAQGTGTTSASGTAATGASGTSSTGSNTAPLFQEVIAAVKDAYA